jgi:hypothetical protein
MWHQWLFHKTVWYRGSLRIQNDQLVLEMCEVKMQNWRKICKFKTYNSILTDFLDIWDWFGRLRNSSERNWQRDSRSPCWFVSKSEISRNFSVLFDE